MSRVLPRAYGEHETKNNLRTLGPDMYYKKLKHVVAALLLAVSFESHAVVIDYTLTQLDADTYQYEYSVTNNDISAGIESFSLWFDYGVASNVSVAALASGWTSFVIPEDDWFFDGPIVDLWVDDPFATPDSVIELGETQSGFSVTFDWLDDLVAPAEQFFDVYNPFPFEILTEGFTTLAQGDSGDGTGNDGSVDVSEPGTLALLFAGLLGLGFARRSKAPKS